MTEKKDAVSCRAQRQDQSRRCDFLCRTQYASLGRSSILVCEKGDATNFFTCKTKTPPNWSEAFKRSATPSIDSPGTGLRGTRAACGNATDGAACAVLWLRSVECAH